MCTRPRTRRRSRRPCGCRPGSCASELVASALAADPTLPLAAGGGALAKEMIRVNHYGSDATREAVLGSLAALGTALAGRGLAVDLEGSRRAIANFS